MPFQCSWPFYNNDKPINKNLNPKHIVFVTVQCKGGNAFSEEYHKTERKRASQELEANVSKCETFCCLQPVSV